MHEHLSAELAKEGVRFEKIYIAPEHPEMPSRGRKPSPQFLFDARDECGINLEQSYMVGDKLVDLAPEWWRDATVWGGVASIAPVARAQNAEVFRPAPHAPEQSPVCGDAIRNGLIKSNSERAFVLMRFHGEGIGTMDSDEGKISNRAFSPSTFANA